jgi:hypothetical protein
MGSQERVDRSEAKWRLHQLSPSAGSWSS